MKLSDAERLTLYMLADISKRLKGRPEFDPDFIMEALSPGCEWALSWKYGGSFVEGEKTPPAVSEVTDILEMWSTIEWSFEELSKTEKAKLKALPAFHGREPKFRGFDGNNESEQYGIARMIFDHLDGFSSLKGRERNSHAPYLDSYRRMLEAYRQVHPSGTIGAMSADGIAKVMAERIHPENR